METASETSRRDERELNLGAAMEQHDLAARETAGGSAELQWLPLLGGGLLAGYGLSRGSLSGLALAAVGGGIAYYSMTGKLPLGMSSGHGTGAGRVPDGETSQRVEQVVTINAPIERVYSEWRDIEKLPQIMRHLESVTELGDGRSRWVARAPFGKTVEWDAEILHDAENRVVSWRSVGETQAPNVGAVHFHEALGGRGTEVRVRLEYTLPTGAFGAAVAKLFGEEPSQQIAEDLRRFKQKMETGEVPTTEGQPRGNHPSSLMDAGMDKLKRIAEAADTP